MVFAMVALMLGVTGLYWFVSWYRDRPPKPQAYELLFRRLSKKLARQGLKRRPAEDTRAFLQRAKRSDYPQSAQLARIVDLYNRIKYGRQGPNRHSLDELRNLINAIQ